MEFSMQKYVIIAALLSMLVTPALAAEFYVAQDPSTKKCTVVEEKPDGKTSIMIGTASYATKKEARDAKKAAAECKGKPAEAN
jgi:hypothetical protein